MTSKEERSLMNMGGSLVVSLPQTWLNFHGVKAGDNVQVITRYKTAEIRLLNNSGGEKQ